VAAPAKLTWSLSVGKRRADGLHELEAEMLTVDLADQLVFVEPGEGLELSAEPRARAELLEPGEENLVVRALRLAGRAALVKLHKAIPLGAGLGGGSADAAAALRFAGLEDLQVAASLGSDVPFCLLGGRARVRGIGELVEHLEHVERRVVLLIPPVHVDTGAVYRAFDELREQRAAVDGRNELLAAALAVAPSLVGWKAELEALSDQEPVLAGSGSTFFLEGSKASLGLEGLEVIERDGSSALLIEARSVPSSFGAPGAD
jgi:4-diphosphocytidyl-2-C-methyl-D-erythritol kinase